MTERRRHIFDPCAMCGGVRETVIEADGASAMQVSPQCRQEETCRGGLRTLLPALALESEARSVNEPSTHRCAALGCTVEDVPLNRDWCPRHFSLIPERQKSAIRHARFAADKTTARDLAKTVLERIEFGERLL